ncbi:MAG: LamG domain-containing protein [Sedimentisphaerales bacterium]
MKNLMEVTKMTRLTIICISFITISLMFAGQSYAEIDPDTVLGMWLLDEGRGDITADASINGNHGTLEGGPTWIDGVYGKALDFSGSSSYVDCGNAETLNVEVFSVSFWCNIPNTQSWNHIISRGEHHGGGNPGAVNWGVMMYDGQETILYEVYNDTVKPSISVNTTTGEWHHVVATHDETTMQLYHDGQLAGATPAGIMLDENLAFIIGAQSRAGGPSDYFDGSIDEVGYFNAVLAPEDIEEIMNFGLAGIVGGITVALNPQPADGALHEDMWVTLGWQPSDFAVSHDVYLGDDFGDVNEATRDSELFRGNQDLTFYIAGFPGYAYPDGLVNGTTYYWRIDEVNDADPNSPWKGDVWSFSIPPKTAYEPSPVDGAEFVDLNAKLTWTTGFGAKLHYIILGEDFDEVNNAAMGVPNGTTTYNPGQLKLAKTYYWRVDEFDGAETLKGDVWSFTTLGAVSGPNPTDGAVGVNPSVVLNWDAGAVAASHEVYFGTDADAVKNATTASPEYKGPKALGEENYDPGKLTLNTTYYWRIEEVNGVNPDSPWAGNVWSFTTSDFFVIDDFEDYDAGENQIWFSWHDGLGYGTPGTADYFAGNGTGAAVGDENTLSYTEETIVYGGNQSMPIAYDNNKQGSSKYSEVELTLTDQRDWTAEGVAELSIWFRGNPASVGSFIEGPVGTYTMTASGADIWNQADEFHFAYKMLTGTGSIVARVESVDNTDPWAKAGVMIRETLDAGSKFAAVYITPTNADGTATNGCRFQARTDTDIDATSDSGVATAEQTAIVAPYWVKLERDITGNFRASYSDNGSAWQQMSWNPQNISMSSNVYIGLALTGHNTAATCEAKFSNVTITGTVSQQWTNQDVGITSNAADPLYVAVSNSAGTPAVVVHDDPAAATVDTWTEWVIPLQAFADQGIVLTNVDRIAIGLGTKGNMTVPGGSGKMYIDDIHLYQTREAAE